MKKISNTLFAAAILLMSITSCTNNGKHGDNTEENMNNTNNKSKMNNSPNNNTGTITDSTSGTINDSVR